MGREEGGRDQRICGKSRDSHVLFQMIVKISLLAVIDNLLDRRR